MPRAQTNFGGTSTAAALMARLRDNMSQARQK